MRQSGLDEPSPYPFPTRLSLVSSLILGDTRQHGNTRDGLSLQLTGTVQHETASLGQALQTTQIYEGTNQIQRIVIAKKLFS